MKPRKRFDWGMALLLLMAAAVVGVVAFAVVVNLGSQQDAARRGRGGRHVLITGPLRKKRLVNRYPTACLRSAGTAPGAGLLAAYRKGKVFIADLNGATVATVRGRPPVAWSSSGGYLATGRTGLLWRSQGGALTGGGGQRALSPSARMWAWSPIADCALTVDRIGALRVWHEAAGNSGDLLHAGRVERFAFSADGGRAGLVIADSRRHRSIWIADLSRSRMREVKRLKPGTCCVELGGWGPRDKELLYWAGPGQSVMADGWLLESVEGPPVRRSKYVRTLVDPDLLEPCGGRLLGVVGGDRFRTGSMQLAWLEPGKKHRYITEGGLAYLNPSCAPNGNFAVATRRFALRSPRDKAHERLVVIEIATGEENEIETDARFDDGHPLWSGRRLGVLYTRTPRNRAAEVWFLPEGGVPRFTGVMVDGTLGRELGWSGHPPDGIPPG